VENKEIVMVDKKTWKEFRECGLLWWINSLLHMFGWAIVVSLDDNGEIIETYPARVKFRGFDLKSNDEGYQNVSKYLLDNIQEIEKESRE
jgi:hypothetical protein